MKPIIILSSLFLFAGTLFAQKNSEVVSQERDTIQYKEIIGGQYAFTFSDLEENILRFELPRRLGRLPVFKKYRTDKLRGSTMQRQQQLTVNEIILNEQKFRIDCIEQIIINQEDVNRMGSLAKLLDTIQQFRIKQIYTIKLKDLDTTHLPAKLFQLDRKTRLANLIIENCKNLNLEGAVDQIKIHRKNLKGILFTQLAVFQYPKNLTELDRLEEIQFDRIGNLSELEVETIIENLATLDNLKMLGFTNCGLTAIPAKVKDLSKLQSLSLRKNQLGFDRTNYQIEELPSTLISLDLSFNYIQKRQEEILKLKELQFLYLECNEYSKEELERYDTLINQLDKRLQYFDYDCNRNPTTNTFLKPKEMESLAVQFSKLAKYRTGIKNYENDFRPFFALGCEECNTYKRRQ